MKNPLLLLSVLASLAMGVTGLAEDEGDPLLLLNPYDRLDNGPPLWGIFSKAKPEWIYAKLRHPRGHPSARMPDYQFSEKEVLDIMAYLKNINRPEEFSMPWPGWAEKKVDDLDDDELEAVFDLVDRGKTVWSNARCSVCHTIKGPGDETIGGFVDLRVGGMDLEIEALKLKRSWLFAWIKDPKTYFPQTLMPRFRFSDEEIKALVEYILRDDAFLPAAEQHREGPREWGMLDDPARVSRGKWLIEMSRCVVCHDIEGIQDLHTHPVFKPPSDSNTMAYLAYDLRCLSCHSLNGRGGTYAPSLTSEGSRLFEDWIAKFVQSPDMIRPLSQQMPKFNLTRDEARTVASYMRQHRRDPRIPEKVPGDPPTDKDIQRGRQLYRAKGCVACHTVSEGPGGSVGPSLDAVGARLKPGYIWYHLKHPHAENPYSAEPDYGLTDTEARFLAVYLASKK